MIVSRCVFLFEKMMFEIYCKPKNGILFKTPYKKTSFLIFGSTQQVNPICFW